MAQTLKFGKGTWATKTGSSMAYNDQNGNYKPLPFNVERDSIATRVNKEGLIEVVGKDKLRIDYTDSAKGVALLENSATNILTYSEDFIGSYWLKLNNVTVSAEKVISPDGTLNASQLIFDGTSGGRIEKGLTGLTQGADYSVSVYARVSSGTQVVNFGSVNDFEYTLTTEWQRLTSTEAENDSAGYPRLKCNDAATIEVWGFQLEQNSVASSYIPTSGSTVQRQADVVNGSGNSEVFNDSEGVFFVNVSYPTETSSEIKEISINDGSTSDRVAIRQNTVTNQLRAIVRAGSSNQFTVQEIVSNLTMFTKIVIKYKTNDFALWVNGFKLRVDSLGTTPSGLNQISFDEGNLSDNFYGKCKELGYYDTALTDAELEALTSYRSLNELVTELNLNTL
jgi:hypothetical protein